jgi:hypothetical protein
VPENAEIGIQLIKRDTQYERLDLERLLADQDDTIRERARKLLGDLREGEPQRGEVSTTGLCRPTDQHISQKFRSDRLRNTQNPNTAKNGSHSNIH